MNIITFLWVAAYAVLACFLIEAVINSCVKTYLNTKLNNKSKVIGAIGEVLTKKLEEIEKKIPDRKNKED